MDIRSNTRGTALERKPLWLGLSLALALAAGSASAHVVKHEHAVSHTPLSPAKLAALHQARPQHPATTYLVTNCDDDGPNSLREAAGTAVAGDTIDLTTLTCSTISLTSGSIFLDGVTLEGPGQDALDINGAGNGGASVFYGGGSTLIADMTISGAKYTGSNGNGGCIWTSGSLGLTNARVTGCSVITPTDSTYAARGGGVYAVGNVTLLDATIDNNSVQGYNYDGRGGGIYALGGITAKYSTIDGNDANSANLGGYGGGLFIGGADDAYFVFTTISNNAASYFNGGMELRDSSGTSAFTFVNSTLSGNRAGQIQGGAGVYMEPYMANSTVAFNEATEDTFAVGLYVQPVGRIESSIFANNMADNGTTYDLQSVNGSFTGSNNLITATGSSVPLGTLTDCPNLGPLADNGGRTKTHSIGLDSAAIDQGNDASGATLDQRGSGYPRLFGDGVDIGSYENHGEQGDRIFMNGVDSKCQ